MGVVKVERSEVRLRFGDEETPAPEGTVADGSKVEIIVAVLPSRDIEIKAVGLVFSVDGGERRVQFRRHVGALTASKEQFWIAQFPKLRPGSEITYEVVVLFSMGSDVEHASSTEGGRARRKFVVEGEAPVEAPPPVVAAAPPPPQPTVQPRLERTVDGKLVSDLGVPGAGVRIALVHRAFGGEEDVLGETVSDDTGAFHFSYGSTLEANLSIVARDERGDVPLSRTRHRAGPREVLDLVVPDRLVTKTRGEHELLVEALRPHAPGPIGSAVETERHRDITMLHRASRWDARLVALAALAQSTAAETGIAEEALYGAFRAGVPCATRDLSAVDRATFAASLDAARVAGVVALSPEAIEAAVGAHETWSRAQHAGDEIGRSRPSSPPQTDRAGVLGWGAYLRDLLEWLRSFEEGEKAAAVLLERRPDIARALEDDGRAAPAADLVIDVLTASLADRNVQEQPSGEWVVSPGIVSSLLGGPAGHELPFDAVHEGLRELVAAFGVPLHDVVEAFGSNGQTRAETFAPLLARLGLGRADAEAAATGEDRAAIIGKVSRAIGWSAADIGAALDASPSCLLSGLVNLSHAVALQALVDVAPAERHRLVRLWSNPPALDRHASLAAMMGIGLSELEAWAAALGQEPCPTMSTEPLQTSADDVAGATVKFVESVKLLTRHGLSAKDAKELVRASEINVARRLGVMSGETGFAVLGPDRAGTLLARLVPYLALRERLCAARRAAVPGVFHPSPDEMATLFRSEEELPGALASLLGCDAADVERVAALLAQRSSSEARLDPEYVGRLVRAFEATSRLGLRVVELIVGGATTPDLLKDVRDALRARVDESTWRATTSAARERFAGRLRSALLALAFARGGADAIERLALDPVSSSSETMTVAEHAASSVVRFVRRALLGLEPAAPLSSRADDAARARWETKASYEVWKLDRERVLFPENTLEPSGPLAFSELPLPMDRQLGPDVRHVDATPSTEALFSVRKEASIAPDWRVVYRGESIGRDGHAGVAAMRRWFFDEPLAAALRAATEGRFGEAEKLFARLRARWAHERSPWSRRVAIGCADALTARGDAAASRRTAASWREATACWAAAREILLETGAKARDIDPSFGNPSTVAEVTRDLMAAGGPGAWPPSDALGTRLRLLAEREAR